MGSRISRGATDGEARGAVLRVAGPGRRAKHLRQPVQRLYPIEMPAQEKSENSSSRNPYTCKWL